MMKNEPNKPRSMVYIDGFNLYYGVKSLGQPVLKWLNIHSLSESFAGNTELVRVNYFTAKIAQGTEKSVHQNVYLEALATLPKVATIYGHFLSKGYNCRKCNHYHNTYEEKRTDVNIACQMLIDSYENSFDVAFVVSGDGDLVAPIKHIISVGKKVVVISPPKRKSRDLIDAAGAHWNITKKSLAQNLLPFEVKTKKGKTLTIPQKWKPKGN